MSSTAAPYGFIAVRHPSGNLRADPYPIGTGYATAIGKGDAVILNTDGTLNIGTATNDILGIFAGVQYTDANGVPTYSPNWVASTTATNIVGWVYTDPATVFSAQANGSLAATSVGDQCDLVAGTVNATTGLSTMALNSTPEGAGVQGQFRVIGLDGAVNNAWGDTYTQVLVQIAQSQFVANKVGI